MVLGLGKLLLVREVLVEEVLLLVREVLVEEVTVQGSMVPGRGVCEIVLVLVLVSAQKSAVRSVTLKKVDRPPRARIARRPAGAREVSLLPANT